MGRNQRTTKDEEEEAFSLSISKRAEKTSLLSLSLASPL